MDVKFAAGRRVARDKRGKNRFAAHPIGVLHDPVR
jgi:hypothetical protein